MTGAINLYIAVTEYLLKEEQHTTYVIMIINL